MNLTFSEVGEYLESSTPPNSTMAILGLSPELLFYAHRCSVTGYVYMYDIVQDQPYRKLMERGLIHEVEQGKPDYVVLVNQRLSWLADTRAELGPLTSWIIQFTDGYEPLRGRVLGPDSPVRVGAQQLQGSTQPAASASIAGKKPLNRRATQTPSKQNHRHAASRLHRGYQGSHHVSGKAR